MTQNKPRLRPYPQSGTIAISNGDELPVPRPGNFIRVRSADQTFTLKVDNDVELVAQQNDVYRFPESDFKTLSIVNDSGSTLNVQLEIGFGSVETNNVSISGTLKVDDDETQTALSTLNTTTNAVSAAVSNVQTAVTAIQNLLTNTDDKRTALTDLSGATYAGIQNGTITLATALANVNGVIIRTVSMISLGTHGNSGLKIGSGFIFVNNTTTVAAAPVSLIEKDIFIPAGQQVDIQSGNMDCIITCYYEVL